MNRVNLIKINPKLLSLLTDLSVEELKEVSVLKEFKDYKGDLTEFIKEGGNMINRPNFFIEYPEKISILYLYANLTEMYSSIYIKIDKKSYNLENRKKDIEVKIYEAIKENLRKEKEEDILVYLKNKPELIYFLDLTGELFFKLKDSVSVDVLHRIFKIANEIPEEAFNEVVERFGNSSIVFKVKNKIEEKKKLINENPKLLEKAPADILYKMLEENIFLVEKFNILNSWIRHCSIKERLNVLENIVLHEIFDKNKIRKIMESLFHGKERKHLYFLCLNYIREFEIEELIEKQEEIERMIIEGVSIGKQTLKFFVYKTKTKNKEILKRMLKVHPSYIYKIKNPSKELIDIAEEKLEKRREAYLFIEEKDLVESECFVFFKTKAIYKKELSDKDKIKLDFLRLNKICDVNFDNKYVSEAFREYLINRINRETILV